MTDYQMLSEKMINYRRELHQIPELGFHVNKTSAYIQEVLQSFDCTLENIADTGITAYYDFGKKETIVFRADMDGLPIQEKNTFAFASKHEGKMHACGHDGHMAVLLGFAEVLDNYKKAGFIPEYNALLVFQPAEETILGALEICKTDLFARYGAKAIYGLHLWPMLEKGVIGSCSGPMMAKSTAVDIMIKGVSAHCGDPDKGKDALEAACRFVSTIYDFKKEEIKDRCILKFGKLESGTVRNAISPLTVINGTMRTFHEETWETIVKEMQAVGETLEKDFGIEFSLDVSHSHPAVINTPNLYTQIRPSLDSLRFRDLEEPVMIAEDFSFFQEQLPGVFFFLGTGTNIPLHADTYNIDESVLIEGVKLFDILFKHTK